MSPLRVTRTHELLLGKISPSRQGIGRKVELVTVGKSDTLRFENDLDLSTSVFAGCIDIIDQKGEGMRRVQLDRGDKVIIKQEDSPWVYVVHGEEWGRRK